MLSTINETIVHVSLLARHLDKLDVRGIVVLMLMELGIPTKCIGFELLNRAILLLYEDPTRCLTKDIYKQIVLTCKQNSEEQVDQAIRDVIAKAWDNGSRRAWNWYFSYDGADVTERPTNSDFISRLARIAEFWSFCGKGGNGTDE